jgi:hypothetical protein
MIAPAQPTTIADDMVSRENAIIIEAKNAAAPRVPYYYRCEELSVLEPWQRGVVVRAATLAVSRNWRVVVGLLLCVVVWVSAWFFWAPDAIRGAFLVPFIVTCVVPLFVVRTTLIRRRIATIARSYAPST